MRLSYFIFAFFLALSVACAAESGRREFTPVAEEIFLNCEVEGKRTMLSEKNLNTQVLAKARVSVKIVSHSKALGILVDGPDDYLASATTLSGADRKDWSADNSSDKDVWRLKVSYRSGDRLQLNTTEIKINRVDGSIFVNVERDFLPPAAVLVKKELYGECKKVEGRRKF